jgi:chorismate mutase
MRRVTDSQNSRRLFALRGAISVDDNTEQAILAGTRELVEAIMGRNELAAEQLVSCVFSATTDPRCRCSARRRSTCRDRSRG